ncbi:Hypothetical_protein [Hexamita inflata]|uniref:Hypothetical_protein n=1 Tax=Hexamita inflata TaxID=28002 RepID=A0AA86NJB7_9EUKA|nr:Hypothetical protein HINF_LOCUS8023 [Hexamita inflata]
MEPPYIFNLPAQQEEFQNLRKDVTLLPKKIATQNITIQFLSEKIQSLSEQVLILTESVQTLKQEQQGFIMVISDLESEIVQQKKSRYIFNIEMGIAVTQEVKSLIKVNIEQKTLLSTINNMIAETRDNSEVVVSKTSNSNKVTANSVLSPQPYHFDYAEIYQKVSNRINQEKNYVKRDGPALNTKPKMGK